MTERQKKLAIITITVIGVIILLLYSKSAGGTIVTHSDAKPFDVSNPSQNMPERTGMIINIPGLPSFTPYQFSPISPCMCNGAEQLQQQNSGLQLTFVTNQGSSGPNIYNYQSGGGGAVMYGGPA